MEGNTKDTRMRTREVKEEIKENMRKKGQHRDNDVMPNTIFS